MRENYEEKLSGAIMTRNYELVYYVAQNVEIIGILAYPKIMKTNITGFKLYTLSLTYDLKFLIPY